MEQKWLFKGNTLECIKEFATYIDDFMERPNIVSSLVKFVGCSRNTALRWLAGNRKPLGEYLLSVRYFLWYQGYRVKELYKLDPVVFKLGRLIAFRMISLQTVTEFLEYDQTDSTMRILHGKSNMSRHRYDLATQIIALDIESEVKINEMVERFSLLDDFMTLNPPTTEKPVVKHSSSKSKHQVSEIDSIKAAFIKYVEAGIPLAEILISDVLTDDDRRQLRRLIANDGLFELANLLNGLCSKESRRIYLENN